MASIIRIKRSSVSGNPNTLAAGELAYSALADSGSNGGDRLYIGIGSETAGNAANHLVIGGTYFTDKLDHTPGTLTASSALIVDADKKLDQLKVDNLDLNGNTLSSSTGSIILSGASGVVLEGTGNEFIAGGSYGGNRLYLPTGGGATLRSGYEGGVSLQAASDGSSFVTLNLASSGTLTIPGTIVSGTTDANINITPNGDGKTVITNAYIGDTSTSLLEYIQDATGGQLIAGEGIDIAYDDTTGESTISAEIATDTNLGVASFGSDFSVTSGAVSLSTLVNSNTGDFGSTTAIPVITVNDKGLITAVTTAAISTSFDIDGDTGTASIAGGSTLTIEGGTGITTSASTGTLVIDIDSTVATLTGTQGLENKTISGSLNTLTDIANSSLTNSSVTFGTTEVSLGGSSTTIAGLTTVTSTSFEGELTGNASTATALQTSRTISLSGDVSGSVSFDGTGNVDITATIQANSVELGSDTTGNYVATIDGTTNQISVSGSGSESAGITLSLPQDIHSGATPTFAGGSYTGEVAMGSNKITGLAEPTDPQDAATKYYVDAARTGLDVKESVRAATTENITLSGTQTIDGVALSVGDRVLVKNQTDPIDNGIYIVKASAWTRSEDADQPNEVSPGLFLFVEEGDDNQDNGYVLTSDTALTVGTDPLVFTQFSGAGQIVAGSALTKTGNTLDVQVASNGGIEIVSDALQLKSSVAGDGLSYSTGVLSLASSAAGDGLSYSTGVLAINTANGIEISGDNVQLAATVAGDGLTYTSGVLDVVGTTNRIAVSSNAIDISENYVGQTSITTLGTIATGTWSATTIATTKGGTGLTSYSTGDLLYASASNVLSKLSAGAEGQVLQINSSGVPVWGEIDGGTY